LTAAFTLIFVSEIGDKVTSLQLKLFSSSAN
jgi:putative Ca2+/H+ antiporter (TMEM165/GDT1 family)